MQQEQSTGTEASRSPSHVGGRLWPTNDSLALFFNGCSQRTRRAIWIRFSKPFALTVAGLRRRSPTEAELAGHASVRRFFESIIKANRDAQEVFDRALATEPPHGLSIY